MFAEVVILEAEIKTVVETQVVSFARVLDGLFASCVGGGSRPR